MTNRYTRRDFMQSTAGGLATAGLTLPFANSAWAADPLTVVEWGPPWIDGSKKVLGDQNMWDVTWELHQGGAAAILPKIKSSWPNTPYDVVDCWTSVFLAMVREGWAETVTVADVPNLADVPESLITKDDQGNFKNIPRSVNGVFFAYRPDICPIEIKTIDDLLDPRLKGQILWPSPIMNTCLQVVALALARGGDEYNIDPGWEFLQELAKSGNIGRVYITTTDTINSLTTGRDQRDVHGSGDDQRRREERASQVSHQGTRVVEELPGDRGLGSTQELQAQEDGIRFLQLHVQPGGEHAVQR